MLLNRWPCLVARWLARSWRGVSSLQSWPHWQVTPIHLHAASCCRRGCGRERGKTLGQPRAPYLQEMVCSFQDIRVGKLFCRNSWWIKLYIFYQMKTNVILMEYKIFLRICRNWTIFDMQWKCLLCSCLLKVKILFVYYSGIHITHHFLISSILCLSKACHLIALLSLVPYQEAAYNGFLQWYMVWFSLQGNIWS